MSNIEKAKRLRGACTLAAAVLLAGTGCQDLDVVNPNDADRVRATENPGDVEAFIGGAFYPAFFENVFNDTSIEYYFANTGGTMTATRSENDLMHLDWAQPRLQHDNNSILSIGNGAWGPRDFWAAAGSAANVPYDGLQLLVVTEVPGGNNRATAFLKFMQGWSWGYLALIFDQTHIVKEDVVFPTDPEGLKELTLSSLIDSDLAIEDAVTSLEAAIAIADANSFSFEPLSETGFWFGTPAAVSNTQLSGMANTLAARLLVLTARTPAERVAVNWARVLAFTTNGVTEDFEVVLNNVRDSEYYDQLAEENSGGRMRWGHLSIGPADQSGNYQAWFTAGPSVRDRFDITTPDRRITGPNPTDDGSYTRYRIGNIGLVAAFGRYYFSAYQWARHAIDEGVPNLESGDLEGTHQLITVDENNLLRAEAQYYLGAFQLAVDLINETRTRIQTIDGTDYPGLPALTTAGVPTDGNGDCVPRTDAGACGGVLTALRYERVIELAGLDPIRAFADSRGFGTMPTGTPMDWPVPGNVLELYGLAPYTYGGVGGANVATYAPVN